MRITKEVSPRFEEFLFDWFYEQYLLIGGYGSGKSYQIAFKIILKLLEEKRKCLVVRQVAETILLSCYSLFEEILEDMNLITYDRYEFSKKKTKVLCLKSPLSFTFPNGSKIFFKGMDNPEKVKSINDISIIWIEECSEISYASYLELLGRVRTPKVSLHFILSCNPIGRENWVYSHFFRTIDEEGKTIITQDENEFYEKKTLIKNGTYYHHSIPTDNPWLPYSYLKKLDDLRKYDKHLYEVARWGKFGAQGIRVLPQLTVDSDWKLMKMMVDSIPIENHFWGMDFGFESSYNAVISCAIDTKARALYIYEEIYINKITDDKMANLSEMLYLKNKLNLLYQNGINKFIVADSEDPKAIKYYRDNGYRMRPCKKFKGSRLEYTRKCKRFKKIIVSHRCPNVIRELQDLTYKKDKNGNIIPDEFNIDPHTFSALWYAIDLVNVHDIKEKDFNSISGARLKDTINKNSVKNITQ